VLKQFAVNSTLNVTLLDPMPECSGQKIGLYTWGDHHWKDSPFLSHLAGTNARKFTCGDIFVNVADYSSASSIKDKELLLPFLINVRRTGNRGVIWMTYGDVIKRDLKACKTFVDTFYGWLLSVPEEWLDVIKPIGLSYDIEQFPASAIEETLSYAQQRKSELSPKLLPDGFLVQSTIDGHYKPVETDVVMRHADRALMMVYRNYMSSPVEPAKGRDGIMERLDFMFTKQCKNCLDDEYATKHYKAKITVIVETSCKMGKSCKYASFCAMDGEAANGGIEYLVSTLGEADRRLISSKLMTEAQRDRLLSKTSPYAVHDWDWFQCFYRDPQDTSQLCKTYNDMSKTCRMY